VFELQECDVGDESPNIEAKKCVGFCFRCLRARNCIKREYKPTGRLCGLVVRVPGYTTEMYCVCCEVRTEFIYVM
jgi:hypothetical protein